MEENIFYNEANDEEEVSQDENENCTESAEESSIFDGNDEDDELHYDNLYSENNENEVEFKDAVM